LPEKIAQKLEEDLLEMPMAAYSSRKNTGVYAAKMLIVGGVAAAVKIAATTLFSTTLFSWALPATLVGLSVAAFIHGRDIRRTGRPIMASTAGRRTLFDEAFKRLTRWSQWMIRIEEGWHRLSLGAASHNEEIAKSLGFVLWPFVPLLSMSRFAASILSNRARLAIRTMNSHLNAAA
jgi:hypothetical protein